MNTFANICGIASLMSLSFCAALVYTKRAIQIAINKADLRNDDRRMIRDVLGIQNP